LKDKPQTARTAIEAATLFVKFAVFNFQISRCLAETWSEPLSDGLHCYEVALNILKVDKPNLAVVLLIEMGHAQCQLERYELAGATFEAAVEITLDPTLTPSLLFDATFNAIEAYSRADCFGKALALANRITAELPSNLKRD
jgi:tetratricopeptide (TPR) repeat protein